MPARQSEPTSPSPGQQEIDFTRAEQCGLLRRAVLPVGRTKHDAGVAPATLKHVLTAIDGYGRGRECFVKVATLSQNTNLSARTVKRAIEALQSLSLICVDRRPTPLGGRCYHYRIVWSELALLSREQGDIGVTLDRPAQGDIGTAQGDIGTAQGDIGTAQGDIGTAQGDIDVTCKRKAMNASQPPPPKRAKTRDGEVGEEDEDGISWSDAEAWLADLGLFAAATATAVARAAGVRPAHVLELAEYFAARRDRWDGDLAVLHQRVRAARVGLAVAAGWKPPCERWRSAQAAARAEYFAAGRARGVPDPVIEDLWRRRCADAVATP